LYREKKLLASTEDFGKDLTGVQNLLKKHQRFEAELDGHDSKVKVRYIVPFTMKITMYIFRQCYRRGSN